MYQPINFADVQFTTVPAEVTVATLAAPPIQAAPAANAQTGVCTDCGAPAAAPGFLGMPGVDFWSWSTWPTSFKLGAGVLGAYAVYKVAMR
jgi:tetrahydromethanopterin S-methyltransferase subunit D